MTRRVKVEEMTTHFSEFVGALKDENEPIISRSRYGAS